MTTAHGAGLLSSRTNTSSIAIPPVREQNKTISHRWSTQHVATRFILARSSYSIPTTTRSRHTLVATAEQTSFNASHCVQSVHVLPVDTSEKDENRSGEEADGDTDCRLGTHLQRDERIDGLARVAIVNAGCTTAPCQGANEEPNEAPQLKGPVVGLAFFQNRLQHQAHIDEKGGQQPRRATHVQRRSHGAGRRTLGHD